jgi:transposase-like protein
VGELNLLIPRTRDGDFSPDLFARMQRSDQALVQAMMEMVVNGVSTRKVTRITEELCGVSFSKSMVSSLCGKWDLAVEAWNERDLGKETFPFVQLDGLYIKVREDGRVQSKCCCIAIGTNALGIRSIIGVRVEDKESTGIWDGFCSWLEGRHLHGVDLMTSDAHPGLVDAAKKHFPGATWQRCQVHMQRDIVKASPRSLQTEISHRYREIVDAPTEEKARILLNETLAAFEKKAASAMDILENGFDDIMAVMTFPKGMRVHIRTSNGIERLNEEVRRRERVIGIFPNKESSKRLLGAVLMEHDEIWSTKTHMNMTDYHIWKTEQQKHPAPAVEQKMSVIA